MVPNPSCHVESWHPKGAIPKLLLPRIWEPKVTVIAALLFPNAILMASDSKELQIGLAKSVPKLEHIVDPPIAWAGAGELEIIQDFTRWLKAGSWITVDWEEFRQQARTELNRLNMGKRASIRQSGSRPKSSDTASVLFAGYLQGVPNILEISDKGESYFWSERHYAAIGSGQNHFNVAKITLESFSANILKQTIQIDAEIFWFLVAIAAACDPDSNGPLQRIEITHEGVKQL